MHTTLEPFHLEHYLVEQAKHASFFLCQSDPDPLSLEELTSLFDDELHRLWNEQRFSYTDPKGLLSLRKEIAKQHSLLSHEQIFTTAGSGEAIYILCHTLLKKGDHVVALSPNYQPLYSVAASCGVDLSFFSLKEEENWECNMDRLAASLTKKTKMLIVNFPHNPTGACLTPSSQKRLIEIAKENDCILVNDEIFLGLDNSSLPAVSPIASKYEKAISIGGVSKLYGLAGLRLGWLATQNTSWIKKFESMKYYLSVGNASCSEILSLAVLRHGGKIVKNNKTIIQNNLNAFSKICSEHKHRLSFVAPKGGMVAFPKLLREKSSEFCKSLLKEKKVLLAPGKLFEKEDTHFRIGLGRKSAKEALEKLDAFLRL